MSRRLSSSVNSRPQSRILFPQNRQVVFLIARSPNREAILQRMYGIVQWVCERITHNERNIPSSWSLAIQPALHGELFCVHCSLQIALFAARPRRRTPLSLHLALKPEFASSNVAQRNAHTSSLFRQRKTCLLNLLKVTRHSVTLDIGSLAPLKIWS